MIVAEKLMGLDPSSPEMTLLLVMLHTGTMFAVILYFWRAWKDSIFASCAVFKQQAVRLVLATIADRRRWLAAHFGNREGRRKIGLLGQGCQRASAKAEIELLFRNLGLVAAALSAAERMILIAGLAERATARNREIGV